MANIDQRRFDDRRSTWLDAAQACARLGVKRATLYTYASRGYLRSLPAERGRARRYAREDVERLRARHEARSGHGPVAAGALRFGEPVLDSSITEVTARGPVYRGHVAVDLARRGVAFERVAELLWTSALPDVAGPWTEPRAAAHVRRAALRLARKDAPPLTRLSLLVPALAAAGVGWPPGPARELDHARALLASMPAALGPAGHAGLLAERLAAALAHRGAHRHGKHAQRAIDRALVVVADHELNASAFTARVAASAGADLHACVAAGLATLSGPRHGGMCDRVEALVREVPTPRDASRVLADRLRRGEPSPGFGHPFYASGDPRAEPLLDDARELSLRHGRAHVLFAILAAMREHGGEAPTVDLGLVALSLALELSPGSAAALFAVGRVAGWVAHAREQRESGILLRPRARFLPKS